MNCCCCTKPLSGTDRQTETEQGGSKKVLENSTSSGAGGPLMRRVGSMCMVETILVSVSTAYEFHILERSYRVFHPHDTAGRDSRCAREIK